jgi:hypothetical protein
MKTAARNRNKGQGGKSPCVRSHGRAGRHEEQIGNM